MPSPVPGPVIVPEPTPPPIPEPTPPAVPEPYPPAGAATRLEHPTPVPPAPRPTRARRPFARPGAAHPAAGPRAAARPAPDLAGRDLDRAPSPVIDTTLGMEETGRELPRAARRAAAFLAALTVVAGAWAARAEAVTVPPGFDDQFVTTLTRATALAFTPDGRMVAPVKDGMFMSCARGRPPRSRWTSGRRRASTVSEGCSGRRSTRCSPRTASSTSITRSRSSASATATLRRRR